MKTFRVEYERIVNNNPKNAIVDSDLPEGVATIEHLTVSADSKEQAEEIAEDKLYALSDAEYYDLNILSAEEETPAQFILNDNLSESEKA